MALWTKGAVPSQYRLVGPGAWPGAREAVLGAEKRLRQSLGPNRLRPLKYAVYDSFSSIRLGKTLLPNA